MKKCMIECGLGKIMALWICVWGLLVCTSSCDSDRVNADGIGMLRLSLSADTTSLNKGIGNPTKAAVSDEFETFLTTADYTIRIVQQSDTVQSYDRFDEMPSEVELKEGAYTLIASKGDNLPSAFENPYFEGSADFTVKAGMSTPIDVTCTLGNARITVDYTEDFKEAYSDYTVLLSSAFTSGSLEIKKGETRPAYMQVAEEGTELGVAIRLKKITEDKEKTYKIPTPLSIERRQNIRLIFKTDGEALDGIGLEIILDDEMTNVTLNEGIPDFMWKPFEKPTLSPDDFTDGESFTIKVGKFEKSPTVGFAMPAGIASLCVKQWREDKENEEITYDLATDEGVTAALGKNFKWSVNGKANTNVKGERKTGQLFLKDAINSLEAPIEEDQTYTYHYEFSGVDATGKAHATNVLGVTVVVQPAGQPIITFDGFPETTIIEGDDMSKEIEAKFEAEGIIDETKTTLTINDGVDDKVYNILTDGTVLYNDWGISVESGNDATATLKFPKVFSSRLEAPTEGEKTFTYKLDLADKKGRSFPTLTKTLTVKAPVFELKTTDGDAFAKRIVLRADVIEGSGEKLSFQYREGISGDTWIDIVPNLRVDGIHCVDTLKGLTESTDEFISNYSVRVVYHGVKERISEPVTVSMEIPGELPNKGLEEWSIAPDANGNTEPGADVDINGFGGLFQKIPKPYRCWEIWQPWSSSSVTTWNTLNIKTTSAGGLHDGLSSETSRKWTRYVANSGTIQTEGKSGYGALIRTVGWGAGNSATTSGGLGEVKECTPGELYLGTYDGTANYGIPFSSRPSGFSFDYKYERKNSDKFIAEIVVLDQRGEIIAKANFGSMQVSDSWIPGYVKLDYIGDSKQVKAASMYIRFVSGSSTSKDDLMVYPPASNLSNGEYVGSQLYVDNIKLIYE